MTQENPSVQFDCRAICLNCSAAVALRLPGPVAWEWGKITGVHCECGKPDFLVVQAEPLIPSKTPRIQPVLMPTDGFDRKTHGIMLVVFAVFGFVGLVMMAVAFIAELMQSNSP